MIQVALMQRGIYRDQGAAHKPFAIKRCAVHGRSYVAGEAMPNVIEDEFEAIILLRSRLALQKTHVDG